ncbi:MAG: hypothetical protein E7292_10310 [Lachnospiraceae bacterium]|nr:hypothetical protein [Lachnospiraceae bacterium]
MKAAKELIINKLKNIVIILAGSALIGTLLLVLVFCIPTGRIKENVHKSVDRILVSSEQFEGNAFLQHIVQNKESYTDSIMVQYAFEKIPDKNVYEHAMWAYHYDLEEEIWAAEDSLRAVLNGADTSQMHLREYSRYWHGYLVYLKPLLLIFSWEQLVWIELGLHIALLLAVAVLFIKKKVPGAILALVAGLAFMKPELMMVSLTMSVSLIIMSTALIVQMKKSDWLAEKGWYPEFFLVVGILTSYLDFLTYPVVTLGFPLGIWFLMAEREAIWTAIKRIVGYSFCWGVGYAGMWASKWIIADLTLQTGTIRDAVWNVIGRTEAIGGRPRMNGGFYVLSLNLQEYGSSIYMIMAGVLIVLAVASIVWAFCAKVPVKTILETIIPFIIIGIIPFAWIIVVQHHSALHARFTFRILGVAAFALACLTIKMQKTIKINKNIA